MSRVLAILGPTAAGKTGLAIDVASRIGAEVVSVDSMQVYRGMDIGTAKPTIIERRGVPHHMIDVADPDEEFTAAEFRRLGRKAMDEVEAPVLISGGSGLHFRALVDPMSFAPTDDVLRTELETRSLSELVADLLEADPEATGVVDMANKRRVIRALEICRLTGETPSRRAASAEAEDIRKYVPEITFTAVGVDAGPATEKRIDRRLDEMRAGGLLEEVCRLRGRVGRTARRAVGYRELFDHLDGRTSLEEAFAAIGRNTRRLARKQRAWFQRDPRIRWIPWIDDDAKRVDRVIEVLG